MAVEERRRIALHRAAAATWGEEVADTLVELVAPSGHELATRADIELVLAAMGAMDERWDARMTAMDERWDARQAAAEARAESMEHRLTATFERGIRQAITAQTRTLVLSQLGAIVVVAGLAFGLGS